LPGDEGFSTWVAAVNCFYSDVKVELIRYFGDDSTVEVLGILDAPFPLDQEPL
jgi:hypothetical protein